MFEFLFFCAQGFTSACTCACLQAKILISVSAQCSGITTEGSHLLQRSQNVIIPGGHWQEGWKQSELPFSSAGDESINLSLFIPQNCFVFTSGPYHRQGLNTQAVHDNSLIVGLLEIYCEVFN